MSKPKALNKIIAIRFWPSSIYSRLTVEASSIIATETFFLDNPQRLVINISISTLSSSTKINGITTILKIAQFDHNTVKNCYCLKSKLQLQHKRSSNRFKRLSYQYRYVFDLYPVTTRANNLDDPLLALLSPSPSPPTNKTIGRHEQSKKIIVMI